MNVRRLVTLLAVCAFMVAAAPRSPSAAMMRPINAALAAVNTANAQGLSGTYTSNATIVDEFPPFVWGGANAGSRWISDFNTSNASAHLTSAHGMLQRYTSFQTTRDHAYLALPVRFTGKINGKPFVEQGIWSFALTRSGGSWLITSQSWGTVHMSM